MGMLVKSLKHSIWYASKILHGTRYAEQNKEVRGTPWGEGGIASIIVERTSDTINGSHNVSLPMILKKKIKLVNYFNLHV